MVDLDANVRFPVDSAPNVDRYFCVGVPLASGPHENLLHGSVTWTVHWPHYEKVRTTHHRMLLHILESHHEKRTYRVISYHDGLEKTECKSIKMAVCTRRLLRVGRVVCTHGM